MFKPSLLALLAAVPAVLGLSGCADEVVVSRSRPAYYGERRTTVVIDNDRDRHYHRGGYDRRYYRDYRDDRRDYRRDDRRDYRRSYYRDGDRRGTTTRTVEYRSY